MDLQASFGVLSEVIEQYESRGRSVRNVEATAADSGDRLRATLSVPVCLCASADDAGASVVPETAALSTDGIRVEFAVTEPPFTGTDATTVTVTDRDVRVSEAGDIVLTVDLVIEATPETAAAPPVTGTETDGGSAADGEPAGGAASTDGSGGSGAGPQRRGGGGDRAADAATDPLAAVRDESVPPYEDGPYLQRLYEACDTFDEMRHEISMDVSAETVRRYMIEAGVHDPTTYDTADGADDAATDADGTTAGDHPADSAVDPMATVPDEQLLADGIGLPAELRITDVADAVVEADTVYEVRDRLDLAPGETRDLLQHLDLIDLVMRRIGDDAAREVTHETVANRLRECARSEPDTPTAT